MWIVVVYEGAGGVLDKLHQLLVRCTKVLAESQQ